MRVFYICMFFLFGLLTNVSAAVFLLNDTPFTLNAILMGSNGSNLGEKSLHPNETAYFEDQLGGSDPVGIRPPRTFENYQNSLTPYTVFWYCKEGNLYSTCENVAAGGLAAASAGQGAKYCKIPPKTATPSEVLQENEPE